MTKTVNSNIRAEMARAGKSQGQTATGSKLSETGFSRRLAGYIPWTLPEIERVAEFLELPMSTLLAGVDNPPTTTEES